MLKSTDYYNKESVIYSKKRYPEKETYFVHFLFKKRLKIVLDILEERVKTQNNSWLLEVGCADGYILEEINKKVKFDGMVGVDISPGMIATANNNNQPKNISFFVRDGKDQFGDRKFDVVLEIGVLNLVDLDKEFEYVLYNLKDDGSYVCSIASKTSLSNVLRPGANENFLHLLSYDEYEKIIEKYFLIEEKYAYGLFIPYIWRVPVLARPMQRVCEFILNKIFPNLFHEKLYILKKK